MRRPFIYRFLIVVVLVGSLTATTIAQTNWQPYLASISFKIKNFGVNVNGSFKGFKGQLLFDPNALAASSLTGSVDAATIDTDNATRDKHLKSDDYFDVEKYPLIEVKSRSIFKKGNDYVGLFNITIKGKTQQEEIPFSFSENGGTATFEGSFTINRRNYRVGKYSLILSDNVTVSIVINAKK